jgi:hypothetical protein
METLIIFLNTVALYFILGFVLSWLSKWASIMEQDKAYERKRPLQVQLILANSGEQLEYVLRHLMFYSKIKGIPVKVCPKDFGSKDETLRILDVFRRKYPGFIQEELEVVDYKMELKDH